MKRKRFLNILLTFVMVLSLLPSGTIAMAADDTTGSLIEQQDTAADTENDANLPENTNGAEEGEESVELTETPAPTEAPAVSATPITGDVKVYAKWTEIETDQPAFNDVKTVDGVKITVDAPKGVFPEGSYLSVERVPVFAQSIVDEAVENERDANANVAVSYTFDIKVLDAEGNEVQPADAQSVKVSFALAEAKDDNLEAQVYHISDEGNAEVLDTSVNGDAVEAVTDGFSFYTVEFTYGTMTYVLPGGSEVKLSDVLSYVGLSGEVTAASGSNDDLFSITKESGEWMIHSHQPFNTEEKFSVTINGIVYEIIVTDTNVSGTIYASSLADNDNLVLTGDTTLVMDVNKSLKSISGGYALTIQGSNTLEVNNNAGHAISVKSLTSTAFLRLISSKDALNIEQNINTSGGMFIISGGVGAYSKNGNIIFSGKSTISSGEAAIFAPKGSISVNGDLTAETTKDKYFCVVGNNGVTLTGGTVSISSKAIAVRTAGDIELSGNITVTGRNIAINSYEGSVIIKEGSTVKASADYGIYATQNVTMGEGGTLTVTGTGHTGIEAGNGNITLNGTVNVNAAQAAIYSPKGSISVNGDLTAETTKDKYFCVVGNNGVTLTGGTVSISSKTIAVRTAGDIELSGNITVTGRDIAINSYEGSVIIKEGSTVKASADYGIYATQNVTMGEGGTLTVTGTGHTGIEAGNGNITLNGTVNVNAAQAAIYSPKGSISVNGDLTAETTNGKYFCVVGNNGVTLTGGTVSISSKTIAVRTAGDIELSGNITVSSADSAAVNTLDGGNILIKNGSTIKATGKYGLYAAGGITVEGGTVNAQGSSNAVYSNTGTITIHSPLAITTPDGGRVSGKTIVGSDGKTATEVVIQNRPLPGSVSIANGVLAEVGDVLTLDFSSDFPWSGRSVQWQKEVGGGTWEDIPGETHWTYTAKAADQGRAFRVRVTVAGYSGEKFSNPCTILVKPTLGGTVTYNGSAYVGREVISYRDGDLNEIYYNVPTGAFHYQWEISNNGSTGWTKIDGATTDRYTPVASDDGKYIRVYVTVTGYTGSVYGSVLKVSNKPKAENYDIPATPELTTESPYTTVTITNAKASQEYVFNYTGLRPSDSDWSGAQSPAADGTLTLNVDSGKLVRVYTRYKETETTNAGTEVRFSYIPTYAYVELQGIEFDKNELIVVQPGTYELNLVPIPDDFEWGARPVTWTFDNNYVQLFKDAYGLQPISSGDKVNGLTKVFVRGTGQTTETIITADAQIGATRYTAYCSAEVSDNMQQFALRHLDFGAEIIEPPGTNSAIGFKIIPGNASVGTVTFDKTSGPASTLGLTVRSIESATGTLDVHVPADAKEGTYVYSVKVDGADTPEPSTLTITVLSDKVTVTFDANGGFGNMAPETMWLGTWYILPECGFTAPDGMEFDGWDKGAPGDYITVGENTKITAQWKPHVHDMVFVPGFEATCEWDGNTAYYICDGCGKWYEDAAGSVEITDHDSVIIPATGHTPGTAVKENEIDATCTEAGGYDEVVYCTVCHDELSRTHTDIPATGHTLTHVPAKSATCTEDGNHAYYECSVCGDWFEDATGTVKITDSLSVIIDALVHDWGEWVQTKAPTTTEEGEETRTCSRCHETETRSIPKLGVTSYEIIVNVGAHGSAHASAGASEEGKTITITATPDSGYEIDKITWTPDGGSTTDITSSKSFTMPAAKVTVNVSFKASSVTPPGPVTVTSISIATPGKTAYTVGEALDVSGMEIKVDYSDGTSATIPVTAGVVSGFDSSVPADSQTLTITYEGKTTTYDVSISASTSKPTSGVYGKDDISPEKPMKVEDIRKTILSVKDEKDTKGSTFTLLKAKGVPKSNKSIRLSWSKVPGAEKYMIYGNKCGKKNKYKYVTTVTGTSYTAKKLKKGTYYKYTIVAVKGDEAIATSKTIHVVTDGGKKGNNTKVKLSKTKLSLNKGKSKTIKATLNSKKKVSIHRKVAWESDNLKVAKVNSKGKITAVGKGTCYVYAYAQNGVAAKIKVTVK